MKTLIQMNKELIYLTYQTFPSEAANTIQTMDNIKYLSRKGYNVKLIFPLRSKDSTDNKDLLKKYYGIKDEIILKGIKHNFPFGKIKFAEKYLFIMSHYLWSKKICKSFKYEENKEIQFFTRSDWVFYFLSKKGLDVIFECHQLSKIRRWVLKNSIHKKGAKIIFLNERLLLDAGPKIKKYSNKIKIIPNGVDDDLFLNMDTRKSGEIVFSGNLQRFNDNRGLDFIINSFLNENMPEVYSLKIIGGPFSEVKKLEEHVSKLGLREKIKFLGRLDRKLTISNIESADIGLLINSSKNLHSLNYASPLKYFEYLFAEIKVVAVDFPSHRSLPFSENISFFSENNEESFINAINKASKTNALKKKDLESISMESRVKEIISLINS